MKFLSFVKKRKHHRKEVNTRRECNPIKFKNPPIPIKPKKRGDIILQYVYDKADHMKVVSKNVKNNIELYRKSEEKFLLENVRI